VLCDQVRSVDWRARKARRAGDAGAAVTEQVLARVRVLLD
jgi:mRNA-degrading endonuclease toxin of MazEF toxin-antitoxin module